MTIRGFYNTIAFEFLILLVFTGISVNLFANVSNNNYSFKQISYEQGFPGTNLIDQVQDKQGIMWFCIDSIGLCRYDGHKFTLFTNEQSDKNSISSNNVKRVINDENDNLWIATDNGLNFYNKSENKFTAFISESNVKESLPNNSCNSILIDSYDDLWIGTDNGLARKKKNSNKFEHFSFSNNTISLSEPIIIFNICEYGDRTLWLSTNHGMVKFNANTGEFKKWENIGLAHNEPINSRVNQIRPDSLGYLWIATFSGLDRFNIKTEKIDHWNFDKKDLPDLEHEGINSIMIDHLGIVWIGTCTKGIIVIDPKKEDYTRITAQSINDHPIRSNQIKYIFEDRMGLIWVGTNLEGVFIYNNTINIFNQGPHKFENKITIAPLTITSLKINDEEITIPSNLNKPIKLKHTQNSLSFDFILTDYNYPLRHQFAVFLDGVDQNWKNIGNRNFVTYTNLSHGNYEFQVKGANELGKWSEKLISLKFTISPPFYKSKWFLLLLVIFLLIFGYFIYYQLKKQKSQLEKLINERTNKLEVAYKELLYKNLKIREQNRLIEKHHAELELKVNERTKDLEIAKSKAEESDKLKSSFLANMSHEIRTPLNAISGFSTLVSSDLYSPERKQKYVTIIKANTVSLLKLVEDILDLSKIEAGQLKIDKEYFDINALMSEINAVFQEEIRKKKKNSIVLDCNNSLTQATIRFYSDQIRIRQILVNLLNNALKFTPIGKIEFGYKLLENKILFWVCDTGIGIKPEDINSIFDRFKKIESDKSTYRGTGLGLSISKSLVDMLGGKIWVESDYKIGSNFYFEIPGIISEVKHFEEGPRKHQTTKLNLKNKSVLVVEDEKSNYELLHSFLHTTEVKVVWAQNGYTAEEYCKKEHFDFVLLDIKMPEIDGYETLKLIRNIYPEIPIIAQTAYALPLDEQKFLAFGFSEFLIKPFLREELYSKIAKLFC